MKKITMKSLLLVLMIAIIPASVAFAGVTELLRLSDNTYVTDYHEGYWSDTYHGTLSILGAERYGSNQDKYPNWVRITYVLNGENTRYYLYSQGELDREVRVRKVVFYDDWDFGKKTESYGYYSLAPASISGTSVENGK